jgi:uncharacterized protein YbjT (DUF2867 family)
MDTEKGWDRMKVFQIGAAGGVGRRLASVLVARGDEVTGMHRRPDQAEVISSTGATPTTGDLIEDDVAQIADSMRGHDAVVFSAGAHGTGTDQTSLIDGKGLEKAAEAAALAGARRFVLVSVFPDAGRDRETPDSFEHYMRVKKSADVHLTRTDLDWVVVRPGTLTDEPGDDRVSAGPAVEYGDVSRDNVAAFIAAVLAEPRLTRAVVELTDGEVPAEDAVRRLVG